MKAVILAAGRGTRLGGLTETRPKCLLEIGGTALLDLQIAALRKAGLQDIGAVRGYRGEQLEGRPLTFIDNPDWATSNICSSLMAARAWLGDEDAIVSYADIIYSTEAITTLIDQRGDIVILYDPDWASLWSRRMADPLSDAESFRLGADGSLEDIGGRPSSIAEVRGQYMGLLRLTKAGLDLIAAALARLPTDQRAKVDMTGLLRILMRHGTPIRAAPTPTPWMEIDTAADLALCQAMAATGELDLESS
jgi:L-glutamine-phosphate cytidylyltransferase